MLVPDRGDPTIKIGLPIPVPEVAILVAKNLGHAPSRPTAPWFQAGSQRFQF